MKRPRIAVFGSVHMDVMAQAATLPEKATSGLAHSFSMSMGGKGGNQAVECVKAGAEVFMVTQLGDDDFGRSLITSLKQRGVDCSMVAIAAGMQTGASTVLSAPRGYTSLIYPGAAAAMASGDVAKRISSLAPIDMLVLQLELPMALSLAAARAVRAMRARVVLNPSPPAAVDPELLSLTSLLVVNETEAIAIAGSVNATDLAKMVTGQAVITRGADGCMASDGVTTWHQSAIEVPAKNTVGAGDAFLAGLCVALCNGADMPVALRAGTEAAARKLSDR